MEIGLKEGLAMILSVIVFLSVSGITSAYSIKTVNDQKNALNSTTDTDAIAALETSIDAQQEGLEAQGNYASILYVVLTISALLILPRMF